MDIIGIFETELLLCLIELMIPFLLLSLFVECLSELFTSNLSNFKMVFFLDFYVYPCFNLFMYKDGFLNPIPIINKLKTRFPVSVKSLLNVNINVKILVLVVFLLLFRFNTRITFSI